MDYGVSKTIAKCGVEKNDLKFETWLCKEQDSDARQETSNGSLPDDDRSCALTLASPQLTFDSLLRGEASEPEQQVSKLSAMSALSSHVTSGVLSPQCRPATATNKKCVVCQEEARGKFFGALVCLPCKVSSYIQRCWRCIAVFVS